MHISRAVALLVAYATVVGAIHPALVSLKERLAEQEAQGSTATLANHYAFLFVGGKAPADYMTDPKATTPEKGIKIWLSKEYRHVRNAMRLYQDLRFSAGIPEDNIVFFTTNGAEIRNWREKTAGYTHDVWSNVKITQDGSPGSDTSPKAFARAVDAKLQNPDAEVFIFLSGHGSTGSFRVATEGPEDQHRFRWSKFGTDLMAKKKAKTIKFKQATIMVQSCHSGAQVAGRDPDADSLAALETQLKEARVNVFTSTSIETGQNAESSSADKRKMTVKASPEHWRKIEELWKAKHTGSRLRRVEYAPELQTSYASGIVHALSWLMEDTDASQNPALGTDVPYQWWGNLVFYKYLQFFTDTVAVSEDKLKQDGAGGRSKVPWAKPSVFPKSSPGTPSMTMLFNSETPWKKGTVDPSELTLKVPMTEEMLRHINKFADYLKASKDALKKTMTDHAKKSGQFK